MNRLATTRREFLRAAGVTLALPLFDVRGAFAKDESQAAPRRMVAMNFALGLHGPNFIPAEPGRGYAPSPYLDLLGGPLREKMTVISGTSHPDVTLGHASDSTFLTAARFPGSPSFRNSISLDQYVAEKLKPNTRFPSLSLGTRGGAISFSRAGVAIPLESKPSSLFSTMFITGGKSQIAAQVQRLEDGESILDAVLPSANRLNSRLGTDDRQRLDQYFTAVREVEQRLANNMEWATQPKPRVDYKPPKDVADLNDDLGRLELMMDMVALALQTDSTRLITLYIGGSNAVQPEPGVSMEYHSLSHHGQDPEKIEQLTLIQNRQMKAVRTLLEKLQGTAEGSQTLLDRTAVLFGAAMGNASSHNCKNLPIALAGGGFKHGQHLAFEKDNNMPLCRLYVSMLQWLGVETDQFGSGAGRLPGLELA